MANFLLRNIRLYEQVHNAVMIFSTDFELKIFSTDRSPRSNTGTRKQHFASTDNSFEGGSLHVTANSVQQPSSNFSESFIGFISEKKT